MLYEVQALHQFPDTWIVVRQCRAREAAHEIADRLSRQARWPVRIVDGLGRLYAEYSPGLYGDPLVAGALIAAAMGQPR
jgi:hypothetical protein